MKKSEIYYPFKGFIDTIDKAITEDDSAPWTKFLELLILVTDCLTNIINLKSHENITSKDLLWINNGIVKLARRIVIIKAKIKEKNNGIETPPAEIEEQFFKMLDFEPEVKIAYEALRK